MDEQEKVSILPLICHNHNLSTSKQTHSHTYIHYTGQSKGNQLVVTNQDVEKTILNFEI